MVGEMRYSDPHYWGLRQQNAKPKGPFKNDITLILKDFDYHPPPLSRNVTRCQTVKYCNITQILRDFDHHPPFCHALSLSSTAIISVPLIRNTRDVIFQRPQMEVLGKYSFTSSSNISLGSLACWKFHQFPISSLIMKSRLESKIAVCC